MKKLTPELLLEAYAAGIFPMGMSESEIHWFSPDPRGILPLETFHTPHGLRRALQKMKHPEWQIRLDTDFEAVMKACAARDDTWITKTIARNYMGLFESGHAHSVEVWHEEKLAGGLYGVALGGAFFGESMFHRESDASKIALWYLVKILQENGFILLDTQWVTPHLSQFGAMEIPRKEYLLRLREALNQNASFPASVTQICS